jgi:hypothetical protein
LELDLMEKIVVHRRTLRLDRNQWTALSLRPSEQTRFANNHFHETWHLLSDLAGAHLLGRICWAMSFQRVERTVFVLGQSHLVPNPFDAERSCPVVIVNSDLGTPTHDARIALKRHLPLRGSSEGRVTLSSTGLDRLDSHSSLVDEQRRSGERYVSGRQRRWINRVDGILVLSAPAPVLREWGVTLVLLGDRLHYGMDYTELDWPGNNGEVQIFNDFQQRVSRAIVARESLFPGRAHSELNREERQQIYDLTDRSKGS